jgi:tetratricopeptide (TPR) repeat protein
MMAFVACECTAVLAQATPITVFDLTASPSVVQRADRAYWEGDATESLRLLGGLLANTPDDIDARWRAARASVALGVIANGDELENRWYRHGIAHSDRALLLDSLNADVLRWAVASKGKLAVQTGPRETADLAQEVWTMAHDLLRADPDDGFAHHALGILHYEVMKMSRFKRMLGRLFLGGDVLAQATWGDAVYHHERAVAIEPNAIAFRFGFAQTLARRDRVPEAIDQFRKATSLPPVHPGDPDYQARAQRSLDRLVAEGSG